MKINVKSDLLPVQCNPDLRQAHQFVFCTQAFVGVSIFRHSFFVDCFFHQCDFFLLRNLQSEHEAVFEYVQMIFLRIYRQIALMFQGFSDLDIKSRFQTVESL